MKPRKVQHQSRGDFLRKLLNDYIAVHGDGPVDFSDVFRWARTHKLWEPPLRTLSNIFKREIAQAARQEYYTDPQGRKVRKKHAVVVTERETQRSLWADILSAPPDHMRLSLQQRRRGALGEVIQTKTDMDSYNDNNAYGAHLEMSFNFDEDLAEMQQPSKYPDAPPENSEA
jgi:hypothetical protein